MRARGLRTTANSSQSGLKLELLPEFVIAGGLRAPLSAATPAALVSVSLRAASAMRTPKPGIIRMGSKWNRSPRFVAQHAVQLRGGHALSNKTL